MKIKAFTSDQHFGHNNIIGYCNRPYYNVEHMNRSLIENYNKMIGPNDNVVWVGDCFFCGAEERQKIMKQLNGHKVLVRGNHDKGSPDLYTKIGFDLVVDTWMMLEISGVCVKVCHYPYFGNDPQYENKYKNKMPIANENEILIHGHTHGFDKKKNNMIHVGVDAWDYAPVPFVEIEKIIEGIKGASNGI